MGSRPFRLPRASLLARATCRIAQLLRDVGFVITPLGPLDAIEESLIDDREPQRGDRLNERDGSRCVAARSVGGPLLDPACVSGGTMLDCKISVEGREIRDAPEQWLDGVLQSKDSSELVRMLPIR